ncbi:MAG: hypothetical protein A2252_11670 [Elusimicrobia bacterium RIFOXYA2_FULL_39_19]|nr:MAG: hypothetical protein A2252_11670 [Elusimicrobia bacterium RIFOXYA2_FULL_39_19]
MIKHDYLKGITAIILSSIFFSAMAGMVRYVSYIDSYKTALYRFVIGFSLLGTAAIIGKINLTFNNGKILFLRGLLSGLSVFIFYLTISKIGLAKATVLGYSFPIFATIGSVLILKEKVPFSKWLLIFISFIGIFLISTSKGEGFSNIGVYELVAILGACISGIALVTLKKLHDTDSSYAIFFAQCAIGIWLVIIPANIIPCKIGISGGVILLLIGITAAVGQLLCTYSYKYFSVSTGSILEMLSPVLNIFIGIIIFGEFVSVKGIIGMVIVLGSCLLLLVEKESNCKNPEAKNEGC